MKLYNKDANWIFSVYAVLSMVATFFKICDRSWSFGCNYWNSLFGCKNTSGSKRGVQTHVFTQRIPIWQWSMAGVITNETPPYILLMKHNELSEVVTDCEMLHTCLVITDFLSRRLLPPLVYSRKRMWPLTNSNVLTLAQVWDKTRILQTPLTQNVDPYSSHNLSIIVC